ncbi:MAG: 5-formyltetrahydrofolate cyclo-ligase [Candidatus Latescibacteria bacterium]|nr:5-formyltetrahydrofolate cyclo-ligase [Candidatus Latescibacterota bacterium]
MITENSAVRKMQIRERMKKQREILDVNLYRTYCMSIKEKCESLSEWKTSKFVHIYVSAVNNEVDTLGLIFEMFDQGKKVIVPKCSPKTHFLDNIRINSLNELKPSKFGVMEPDFNPDRVVNPESFDVLIAPLLAFDRTGNRLGFGGGYYDSLLKQCSCPKIGFAYSFQEIDILPVEDHDQKLTIIITEKEIIRI